MATCVLGGANKLLCAVMKEGKEARGPCWLRTVVTETTLQSIVYGCDVLQFKTGGQIVGVCVCVSRPLVNSWLREQSRCSTIGLALSHLSSTHNKILEKKCTSMKRHAK